ncbi:uncharacterized protein [Rhodnius prolixus]|uniref:uncharacterized protein n=1 Tax=Rhodnius prolixus TaxID=13249 RepID=UPI003D18EC81
MFSALSTWLFILSAGIVQYPCSHAIQQTWIEQNFPNKITQDDFELLKRDNDTGCKILLCPRTHNYYIYGYTCWRIPTDTEIIGNTLFLRTTRIERIFAGEFEKWPQLLSLNIEMNPELVEIETGTFSNLTNLNYLSISNNYKLSSIEPDLFTGLVNLKELQLVKNNLYHLTDLILSVNPIILPSLRSLDLSQNSFDKINSNDLHKFHSKIKILSLMFCGLSQIDGDSFKTLTELRELNLANNNLNANTLSNLISNLTITMKNLTRLSIAGNLLHKDPSKLFQAISLTNITDLDVKDNHFDILKPKLFPFMPNITRLDLSGIMAVNIDNNTFNEKLLPNLTTLIVARNSFPGVLENLLLPNLIELDLSENSCENCFLSPLFKINEFIFEKMENLRILNLAKNALYQVKSFTFYGLFNLEILNLSNCSIFLIEDYSFVNSTNLNQLDLSFNNFLMNYSIRSKTFTGLNNLEMLKLHNCGLNSNFDPYLFSGLPNLKYLTLRDNSLTYINSLWFENLTNLIEIDLANNYIVEWNQFRLFNNNNDLVALNLFSNRLRIFTSDMLEDFQKLLYLDLRDNLWDCTCQLVLKVQDFLSAKNISINSLSLNTTKNKCFSPENKENLELIKFLKSHIDRNQCKNIQLALIIFFCFLAIALLSVGALLIYYLRWHIRYWVFLFRQAMRYNYFPGNNKRNSKDSKYKYDAFVSYSHEDRNFVVRLVAMLETQPPYYKLCVFERDFNVGNIITESVFECLTSSRRTILVLSDSFARSTWCLWEMQLAQHKRLFFKDEQTEPLVIIKIGEIMDRHMTPTLRYLIKSRVYLQWNSDPIKQKLFWQRLREALTPPKVPV